MLVRYLVWCFLQRTNRPQNQFSLNNPFLKMRSESFGQTDLHVTICDWLLQNQVHHLRNGILSPRNLSVVEWNGMGHMWRLRLRRHTLNRYYSLLYWAPDNGYSHNDRRQWFSSYIPLDSAIKPSNFTNRQISTAVTFRLGETRFFSTDLTV